MFKHLFLIFFSFLFATSYSQLDVVKELMNNKYCLIKVKTGTHVSTCGNLTQFAEANKLKEPEFKMKSIIYDTNNVELKRKIKNLTFKKNDTLLLLDWDLQGNLLPTFCAAQFKFSALDSSIFFYNIQHAKTQKMPLETVELEKKRCFKLLSITDKELILQELDRPDWTGTRTYFLKRLFK